MNRKALIYMPVVLSVIMVSSILTGCANKSSTTEVAGTGVVTESTLTDTVESSGSIQADQISTLNWNTSGIISNISVTSGNKIKKGDILMELDSTSVPAEVIQGFVDLANAKLKLEDAKSMSSTANAAVAFGGSPNSLRRREKCLIRNRLHHRFG